MALGNEKIADDRTRASDAANISESGLQSVQDNEQDAQDHAYKETSFTDTDGTSYDNGAEGYRLNAQGSRDNATSLRDSALNHESNAETSANNAQTSANNAQTAKQDSDPYPTDAQNFAQATGSFTDKDGTSFTKGTKGYTNDIQAANNFETKLLPFPSYSKPPNGWYENPQISNIDGMKIIQNSDPSMKYTLRTDKNLNVSDFYTSNEDQARIAGSGDFTIDWGDGNIDKVSFYRDDITHTYDAIGTYTISIYGDLQQIQLYYSDSLKWENLITWGDIYLTSFFRMFQYYDDENGIKIDKLPPGTRVTNMERTFEGSSIQGTNFNVPSNITSLDTSKVTSMYSCFNTNKKFNQDISGWDVSNVTNMQNMFRDSVFNQPIGNWNTKSVTNMDWMFNGNSNFDQDISGWDIQNVSKLSNFLGGGSLSTSNYDALLNSWGNQSVQSDVSAHFGSSKYTAGSPAETARQNLIDNHGWTITDGGSV